MEWRNITDSVDTAERLLGSVRQVMDVVDVVRGAADRGFAARYRGKLRFDSREAFARLDPAFAREGMTLLFRREGSDDVAIAVVGRIRGRPSNPWVNLVLFGITLLSVLLAGVLYGYDGPVYQDPGQMLAALIRAWPRGIPFAASLLAILAAHEFGHYIAARLHHTSVSLPYVLPFPGSIFGTMGAFIQLKEPPRNRRVLLDIGLAGPLAGLVVAIPILLLGLSMSVITSLPASPGEALGSTIEGNSILYLAAKYIVTGRLLPSPPATAGVNPLLFWLSYFFLGSPIPYGGQDIFLHPVAMAGWAGLLVTALNLIPVGQLDGGHVLYGLLGRNTLRLVPLIVAALAVLGLVWPGWWVWAALVFFLGRGHAQPLDDITRLDGRRKALAVLGLVIFVLAFTPVPLQVLG
jgi:membrane-associated protease RseP (regulator of RpoE activity)